MGDLFRLVKRARYGGRPLVEIDFNNIGYAGTAAAPAELYAITRQRDSIRYTPPASSSRIGAPDTVYSGETYLGAGELSNATIAATLTVTGNANAGRSATNLERLLRMAAPVSTLPDLYIEWRPEGLARSVYYPLRGLPTVTPVFRGRAWQGRALVEVEVTFSVAPLAEGDPMHVREEFGVDLPADKPGGLVNEVLNPSAEVAHRTNTALPAEWTNTGGLTTFTRDSAAVSSGLYNFFLDGGTVGASAVKTANSDRPIPVRQGDTLFIAARVTAATVTGTAALGIGVIWSDGNGTYGNSYSNTATVAGTRVTGTVTVPPNATIATVILVAFGGASGGTVSGGIDEVMAVRNPPTTDANALPYFDGDSTAARWEGDAHRSRSIELLDSKLAEWTIDQQPTAGIHVTNSTSNDIGWTTGQTVGGGGRGLGLNSTTTARLRMRHTRRGYRYGVDLGATVGFRAPAAWPADNVGVGVGVALHRSSDSSVALADRGNIVYARMDVNTNGSGRGLYVLREAGGAELSVLASADSGGSGTPPYLLEGREYFVTLARQGSRLRAELWYAEPEPNGGTGATASTNHVPLAFTPWVNISNAAGVPYSARDSGVIGEPEYETDPRELEPFIHFQSSRGDTRLTLFKVDLAPQTLTGAHTVRINGVPGNAPAKLDVMLGVPATSSGITSGIVATRRWRPYNLIRNGDLAGDLDGWSAEAVTGALVAGGSVSRRTDVNAPFLYTGFGAPNGPATTYGGDAVAQVTATTTANTGGAYRHFARLRRHTTYTVEVFTKPVSNTTGWEALVALDNGAEATAVNTALPSNANGFARTLITFRVGTIDRERIDVVFRSNTIAGGSLLIAHTRLWEGTPDDAPSTYANTDGRGAFPCFGFLGAEADDPSLRVGFAVVVDADAVPAPVALFDRALSITPPATAGTARAFYNLDAALLDLGERDEEDAAVAVYAIGRLHGGITSPTMTVTATSEALVGGTVSTIEYGSSGRAIARPAASVDAHRTWRLGTLILRRAQGQGLTPRTILNYTFGYGASSTGSFRLYGLLLVPVATSATTPTGVRRNLGAGPYPALVVANNEDPAGKLILSDGRGFHINQRTRTAIPHTGLAGAALELEPGDNEVLIYATSGGAIDDPEALSSDTSAPSAAMGVRFGITPRYRLWRPN